MAKELSNLSIAARKILTWDTCRMIPHGAGGAAQGMSVLVRPARLSSGHVPMSCSTVPAGLGGVVLVHVFLSRGAATPVGGAPVSSIPFT